MPERTDMVGPTRYPNCPDPAYTDHDLETIIGVSEKLYLFGNRTVEDFCGAVNDAHRSGFFHDLPDPPVYLPLQTVGFGRSFLEWMHTVVKARVLRRSTGSPEEVLRRDLAVGDELESIAMRYLQRNMGKQGDARLAFQSMEFVMRIQDKRHKLMGLDQTSLVLTNDPSATVAGRVLNALLTDQGMAKKAWMLKQTVKPGALEEMAPDDQALALLRARETDEKRTEEPTENPGAGDVGEAPDGSEVEPPPPDPGLGVG